MHGIATRRQLLVPRPVVLAACVLNGALLCWRGLSPTGNLLVDTMLVASAGACGSLVASTATWWILALAGAVSGVAAGGSIGAATGLAAFGCAASIGAGWRGQGWKRLAAGCLLMHSISRIGAGSRFGASSLVAFALVAVVAVAGSRQWSPSVRHRSGVAIGLVLAAIASALVGLAASSASAKPSLVDANATARRAFSHLSQGDASLASRDFDDAARIFDRISREMNRPWNQPSKLIPVVSQHAESVEELSAGAARLSHELSIALEQIDPQVLRVAGGQVDLDALARIDEPLRRVEQSLVEFGDLIGTVGSPWLVGPLQEALQGLDREVIRSQEAASNLRALTTMLPALLGASGVRHYFVAFITPSEQRGLGGFMGNWAELTADHGKVAMTKFGRTVELSQTPGAPAWSLQLTPEFARRYADFGFSDPKDGHAAAQVWSNITMSPDLPTVADLIAQLYPQSGGQPIDGVIAVDPSAMAALMELTGSVKVPDRPAPLTAAEAEEYILRTQYATENKGDRLDVLDTLAHTVMSRLVDGELPGPWKLARLMGPILARGGLTLWSADPTEEQVFERLGVSGSLPKLGGGDGLSVVINNAAANKIDAYLQSSTHYDVTVDPDNNLFTATATVELKNTAPGVGLDNYVIGNATGEPAGTNHMYFSAYTAFPIRTAEIDGQPVALERTVERGWQVGSTFVSIPPGETRVVQFKVVGPLTADGYRFTWRPQPSALAPAMTMKVETLGGSTLVEWTEPDARRDKVITTSPST